MAKSHEEKQFIQLAGEFGVVSELFRREIQATLTYGNSKSADVFVIAKNGSHASRIEVKSTVGKSWIVDDRALSAKKHVVWIFVHFPKPSETFSAAQIAEAGTASPRYHVLTSDEVKEMYEEKKKGGGFPITFHHSDLQHYLNQWIKVSQTLPPFTIG